MTLSAAAVATERGAGQTPAALHVQQPIANEGVPLEQYLMCRPGIPNSRLNLQSPEERRYNSPIRGFMQRSRCFFLILSALLAPPVRGQPAPCTIVGVFTVPSGAVIPRATVVATNQATGFSRTAATDEEGNY